MKEIPILYSTPMILAKLAGRKTVTRRPINPQPIDNREEDGSFFEGNYKGYVKVDGHPDWQKQFAHEFAKWQPGDILYGRESFRVARWLHEDGEISFRYEADGTESNYIGFKDEKIFNKYWQQSCDDLYKAGYEPDENECFVDYKPEALRLRPNIFLPKDASRIYERVISVRPERLGDITEEDAVREGVEYFDDHGSRWFKDYTADASGYGHPDVDFPTTSSAVKSFISLWQSIHGPESWNPDLWVWRIETEILSTTGRPANL